MSMLANRLQKSLKRLGPKYAREGTTAFRLYDRDIPEYPWTVDVYGDHALASEFVTPVSRRQSAADREQETREVVDAVAHVTGTPPERIVIKARERHVSVEREAAGRPEHEFEVTERGLRFRVNLVDYLDTGLFLDHRQTRQRVASLSRGKRVLNLFCYTGSFSVYAAAAGAGRTVSVDLSATYLSWAARNLAANGLEERTNALVRSDVFEFLRTTDERFDVVVLDPPTLSRAKRGRSFDVQASHPELVNGSIAVLNPGGRVFFSTNFRQFRLDERALRAGRIREITTDTVPEGFRTGTHRCWEIEP